MATLLMRIAGPMQSWGTSSRFDQRDTGTEPSKSGIVGLMAAALGIDRANWVDLEPLTHFRLAVRHDRPGVVRREYQTAGAARGDAIMRAEGKVGTDGGVVSERFYLADACFLAGLESPDEALLTRVHAALRDPQWPLALGRKAFIPGEPVWLSNGLQDRECREAMHEWPWLGVLRTGESMPEAVRLTVESLDSSGSMRGDQPIAAFSERRFAFRYVATEWVNLRKETVDAPT